MQAHLFQLYSRNKGKTKKGYTVAFPILRKDIYVSFALIANQALNIFYFQNKKSLDKQNPNLIRFTVRQGFLSLLSHIY